MKRGTWSSIFCLSFSLMVLLIPSGARSESVCKETARAIMGACQFEAFQAYWMSWAACLNVSDKVTKGQCQDEASETLLSSLEDCGAQYEARVMACDLLNEDIYDPEIKPEDFTTDITNPYFPLAPGTVYVYRGTDEDGLMFEDRVEVMDETTEIDGVECRVVKDVVTQDGEILEETYDFYAQDKNGNVWYFGEDSRSYENGWIANIDGAWYSGVHGARPGIIMKAQPEQGAIYRQEYHPGNAEDMAYVVAINESVHVNQGSYANCVKTLDWSPFEPDIIEYKYFAPGIGFVMSISNTGERMELISIKGPNYGD